MVHDVNISATDRTQWSVKMCSVTVSARLGKGCPLVRSPARLGISRHVQRRTRRTVAAAIDETDRLTTAEEQLKAEASRPVGKFLDENVRSSGYPANFERVSFSGHFSQELVSHSSG